MSANDMVNGAGIAALVLDLMFAARVRGAARDAAVARSPAELLAGVGPATRLVLVDLQVAGAVEVVSGVRERAPAARVVAFGPHVMEEALEAAREAGADEVLPRGRFIRELGELIRSAG